MYNAKIATYRLDLIDLEILLAYMEVDCMWGFSKHKKTDKADIIQGIYRLAQKNIIDIVDEKVNIKPVYMKFLENIKNSQQCLVVESSGIMHKKKCCYIGEEVLVSEVSGVRRGEVILYTVEKSHFFELLREETYFYDEDGSQVLETEEQEIIEYGNFENGFVEENVRLKMEIFEEKYKIATLLITEEGGKKWIIVQRENQRTKSGYKIGKMQQMIEKILDGERI